VTGVLTREAAPASPSPGGGRRALEIVVAVVTALAVIDPTACTWARSVRTCSRPRSRTTSPSRCVCRRPRRFA